jgi:hypothetical protein
MQVLPIMRAVVTTLRLHRAPFYAQGARTSMRP